MSILLNNNQNNTWRAKSARQYLESQKHQIIPREPKMADNSQRAKSTRQYLENQGQIIFFSKITQFI